MVNGNSLHSFVGGIQSDWTVGANGSIGGKKIYVT